MVTVKISSKNIYDQSETMMINRDVNNFKDGGQVLENSRYVSLYSYLYKQVNGG